MFTSYSLLFKIKVTFGEISLKLHQTNRNVGNINVSIAINELPRQIIVYTWLTIDIWTQLINTHQRGFMHHSAQNGGLPMKLVPKNFNFIMDTPSSPCEY